MGKKADTALAYLDTVLAGSTPWCCFVIFTEPHFIWTHSLPTESRTLRAIMYPPLSIMPVLTSVWISTCNHPGNDYELSTSAMIQLRDYQQDLLCNVQVALAGERAQVMMQLPTGGGKTIIAGALLKEWLKGGRKAVWLTHRKELVTQTRELLANAKVAASVDARWKPGDDAPARRNRVAILMAQTVSRRTARTIVWTKYRNDDLMIIDEAHHAAAAGWTRAMQQWPGRILGMTATPWRLSQTEGFNLLFNALVCGPSVADLQSGDHLCDAQVLSPSPQWIIQGGAVGMAGDFTDAGIREANQDHIMTAGALKFWQEHAQDRQTIMYAVSVNHASNLVKVFRKAGVPAAAMLGETKDKERASLIAAFKRGILKVLVNVAVATEGFDLPDASCVVITRPTKSLSLYLQMVGRGLRPKEYGDNCLILDLAANAKLHGMPEDDREWSLEPRAAQDDVGDAVTVWCEKCSTVSPAASHNCRNCGALFGKDCNRCGTWRAWKRWSLEKQCGDAHELVCDLCHRDAHIEAQLPINQELEVALVNLEGKESEMPSPDKVETEEDSINQSLGNYQEFLAVLEGRFDIDLVNALGEIEHDGDFYEIGLEKLIDEYGLDLADLLGRWQLYRLLRKLLEVERKKVMGSEDERQHKLCKVIEERESQLADDALLDVMFEDFISNLPVDQIPQNKPQEHRMFAEWESGLQSDLDGWKDELARLESQPIDKLLIFEQTKDSAMGLLRRAAQDAELLPDANDPVDNPVPHKRSQRRKRARRGIRKSTPNSRLSMDATIVKTLETHSEEIKAEAKRLWDEGQTAKQIAVVLFHQGFGTKAGHEFGTGQVASWLPNRNS